MPSRKRILLLASVFGYQLREFQAAAERLDLDVVLGTDRCHRLDDPWADQAVAVRFHDPAKYAILLETEGKVQPFDAVVAVGDKPTFLAALTAQRLGLPYNSPASVEAAGNKYLARERFRAAGLRVPWYFRVPLGEAAAPAGFPCVLKPLGMSASRGVIRANTTAEFTAAFERIKKLLETREVRMERSEQNRYIQVEEYIPGREFALEGVITDGELRVLALFDKPDPMEGPYFEETIYVTPSREPAGVQAELIETARRGVAALGLTRGPLHAEFRYNERGAWILEMAARPIGGLCARALRFEGGLSLEELVLRHALGEDVSAIRLADQATGVMMIPIPRAGIYQGVSGVDEAAAVPGIWEAVITAKEGQPLIPLPEGASYLGFLFARGERPEGVEAALRQSHARLRFSIAESLPLR